MATNLNGTQAYRFELFEPQQAMPAPKKREVLGINMYSRTRLTVLAKETASIQTSIAEEQSRTVDLQSRLTQKMSTDAILDYATNRLGMVKGNRSQINYITVNGSDSVVYNDDNGSKAGE